MATDISEMEAKSPAVRGLRSWWIKDDIYIYIYMKLVWEVKIHHV